ncbi:MAG: flagellar protein FlgN [Verrucomicrobia bacterium]|nr:flagellar protein FlgN [Verrucomicrobiota bacterium]
MIELLNHLVDSLREELKQYGEMLALMDQQQEMVLQRHTQDLLQTVAIINAQSATIQGARHERQQRQRHLARTVGLADDATFQELLPRVLADYRPLLSALVEENNALLERIQHRARQNHLLLSRALDLMNRFLGELFPAAGATTYNGAGSLVGPALAPRPVLEVVG